MQHPSKAVYCYQIKPRTNRFSDVQFSTPKTNNMKTISTPSTETTAQDNSTVNQILHDVTPVIVNDVIPAIAKNSKSKLLAVLKSIVSAFLSKFFA